MLAKPIFYFSLASVAFAQTFTASCSAQTRIWSAQQVVVAYASNPLATFSEFDKIGFGVPDKSGSSPVMMYVVTPVSSGAKIKLALTV